ncbi:DUF4446 family protein [Candidatus Woesebacteria bacterium]|jgi:hypothetical protein|nr:DUF4446 family protein [Candidatus Woesebacteria bacterium]
MNSILLVLVVFSLIVSLFSLYKVLSFQQRVSNLFGEDKKAIDVLEEVQKKYQTFDSLFARGLDWENQLTAEKQHFFQRMGFVRFNPFAETGGDQSFSVSLLDAKGTGIVFTGLHTREKTRVYAKPIVNGVSKSTLSKEEQKAIEIAMKKSQ